MPSHNAPKVIFFANTDWYLYNFRLPLAKAIRDRGGEVVMISPPGPYGERLGREGFRWISLPMVRKSLNPLQEVKIVLALARIYRQERPTLVHHFTLKCVIYGSIAARLAAVPFIVNAAAGLGYVFTSRHAKARILKPFVKVILSAVLRSRDSRLIVQNPDDGDQLVQHKLVEKKRVRLIRGSGVNTELFTPNYPVLPQTPLRVLLATRLLWDKGVREYVDAARSLKAGGVELEFLLAGTGDNGNPASISDKQIEAWVREGVITPLGHVEDMRLLLATTDMVVLPSYGEGVPRILLEAAACGLPIVTTDVPGCREIVVHGKNGLLVSPRDAASLASAIRQLAEDSDLRADMGRAGREIAQTEFDERRVIAETIAVYDELVTAGQVAVVRDIGESQEQFSESGGQ